MTKAAIVDYELRLANLKAAGSPIKSWVDVRMAILKKYNQFIDGGQFSKAIRHQMPTERGGAIRKMADAILTEAEEKAGVTA